MLDGLDAIDWTRLVHAYGSAGDIPGLLRDLLAEGADTRERARWCLHGALALYLDFVNLFIMLLRLFGRRR